jgi:hypothetical protein
MTNSRKNGQVCTKKVKSVVKDAHLMIGDSPERTSSQILEKLRAFQWAGRNCYRIAEDNLLAFVVDQTSKWIKGDDTLPIRYKDAVKKGYVFVKRGTTMEKVERSLTSLNRNRLFSRR